MIHLIILITPGGGLLAHHVHLRLVPSVGVRRKSDLTGLLMYLLRTVLVRRLSVAVLTTDVKEKTKNGDGDVDQ